MVARSGGNTTDQFLLTKGDNNPMDDLQFYKRGQSHLERTHIIGKVQGYVPYIGYVTIMLVSRVSPHLCLFPLP